MSVRALKISDAQVSLLEQVQCDGDTLSLKPLGQLDRKVYTDLDKVLREAGGRWSRRLRVHVFDRQSAAEVVDRLILSREVTSAKRAFQEFFTPPELIARMIAQAKVKPGQRALEPSACLGGIAFALTDAGAMVSAYEINPSRHGILTYNIIRQKLGDSFDVVICADFLSVEPDPRYDAVVMNPPFTMCQDIVHVGHALDFVKPGGRLVAILSASAFERDTARHRGFKAKLAPYPYTTVDIEAGAFKAAGTMIATTLLTLHKEK